MKYRADHTEPFVVDAPDGQPRALRLGPRRYRVREVLEEWHARGLWWTRERTRRYLLVDTELGEAEIAHDAADGWRLVRVFD